MGNERGVALVVTLMAMLLLSAIGAALVVVTGADVQIAANAGAAVEAFFAADAALERTAAELRSVPDFTAVLSGAAASAFAEGLPSGERVLPDGSRIDLAEVVNLANCQKRAECLEADLNASIRERPWGPRNPRWRLFSYGPLRGRAGTTQTTSPLYVVSMVADDPSETDADPWRDGIPPGAAMNPGAGVLLVRAEAFGRRGAHRVVEGSIVRLDLVARAGWEAADPGTRGPAPPGFPVLQVRSWREVR